MPGPLETIAELGIEDGGRIGMGVYIQACHLKTGVDARGLKLPFPVVRLTIGNPETSATFQFAADHYRREMEALLGVVEHPPADEPPPPIKWSKT